MNNNECHPSSTPPSALVYDEGLYVRSWKNGDKICSATSNYNILLSDLFINNKLSKYEKLIQPIVVNKLDKILWKPGLLHGKNSFNKCEKNQVINWMRT